MTSRLRPAKIRRSPRPRRLIPASHQAQQQIAVLGEQLKQARLTVDQSRLDAQGRVRQAEAQVATAEANLAQAQAGYEQARYDARALHQIGKFRRRA